MEIGAEHHVEGHLLGFVRTVEKVVAACTNQPTRRINPHVNRAGVNP
jgi:hypothetical protein